MEQVTKEKFLRAIVGDPPLVVGHNENVELEAQLAEGKAELRKRKEDVGAMIEGMEKMGRELAERESYGVSIYSVRAVADINLRQATRTSICNWHSCPRSPTPSKTWNRLSPVCAQNR